MSARCPAGGGAVPCAASPLVLPRTVWKRREAQGQWLSESVRAHVTVAGPISERRSGAAAGGASHRVSGAWCVSVDVGAAGAEGDRAWLCDLERSLPLSGPQFPVSAREFIEKADEILHAKML